MSFFADDHEKFYIADKNKLFKNWKANKKPLVGSHACVGQKMYPKEDKIKNLTSLHASTHLYLYRNILWRLNWTNISHVFFPLLHLLSSLSEVADDYKDDAKSCL